MTRPCGRTSRRLAATLLDGIRDLEPGQSVSAATCIPTAAAGGARPCSSCSVRLSTARTRCSSSGPAPCGRTPGRSRSRAAAPTRGRRRRGDGPARGRGGDGARSGRSVRSPAARSLHSAVRVRRGAGRRALGPAGRCTPSTQVRRPRSPGCRSASWPIPPTGSRAPSGGLRGPAFAVAGLLVWGFTGGLLVDDCCTWEAWSGPGTHRGGCGIWTRHGPRCGPRGSGGRGVVSPGDRIFGLSVITKTRGTGDEARSRRELGRRARRAAGARRRHLGVAPRHGRRGCCRSSASSAARSWACSSPLCSRPTSKPKTPGGRWSASSWSWCSSRWARPPGVYFGRHIRDRIISGERTLVDRLAALGSVLQAATVVPAAWLVALPLALARACPALAAGGARLDGAARRRRGQPALGPPAARGPAAGARQLRLPGRAQPVRLPHRSPRSAHRIRRWPNSGIVVATSRTAS